MVTVEAAAELGPVGYIGLMWHNGFRGFVRGRLGCVTVDVDSQHLGACGSEGERHRRIHAAGNQYNGLR